MNKRPTRAEVLEKIQARFYEAGVAVLNARSSLDAHIWNLNQAKTMDDAYEQLTKSNDLIQRIRKQIENELANEAKT